MKKRNNRFVSLFLTFAMVLSVVLGNGIGARTVKAADANSKDLKTLLRQQVTRQFSPADAQNRLNQKYGISGNFDDNKPANVDPNEIVRVIVQMKDKPAVEKSNVSIESVKASQETVKSQVKKITGATIRNTYGYLVNGFSTSVKRSDIEKIKAISGVKSVTEANVYYPDLAAAKSLTQVYDAWQNHNNGNLKGQGMVVAVIDTGIDASHKDMRLTDSSKAKIQDVKTSTESLYTAKVPYGYNFADQNDVVKDLTSSMHGMHVSGIVGANGTDAEVAANQAVQGVAPEAQLLAMKVFSNDPNNAGAWSDDIVAAIEDSVLHGADVINMSLGSSAAFQDPEDPEQLAIKNAVDNGTMVVVSAGNSNISTGLPITGYTSIRYHNMPDTGLVGSPGLAHDSLQVASYENNSITAPALSYVNGSTNNTMAYFTSEISPVGVLNGEYELVDCVYGRSADFVGKDVTGKIALIQRGGTGSAGFVEKKQLAQAAGAVGVIVYNDAARGDAYVSMATDPSVTIPAIFIGNTDGTYLLNNIANGVKVSFKDGVVKTVANPGSNGMSDFSSWGPTPNLDFKPEITAPGGNIYSTVNSNKYESMSGTSMASPHTAGAEALILQAVKAANSSLQGRDLVEFAKADTINTAKVEMDKTHPSVPYSPRRQGAGMLQIENAINNTVVVKDNSNDAAVSLKEIGKTTTYTLTLTNYGSTDKTYNVGNVGGNNGVFTEYNPATYKIAMPYEVAVTGAALTYSKSQVIVPANGTAKVDVTVTLPDSFATEQFVEGFVKFTPASGTDPELVSPFIGFYGDWSKQAIIDAPMWDPVNTIMGYSTVITKNFYGYDYLGFTGVDSYGNPVVDPDKLAISPNKDGFNDNVTPLFTFLRNAKEMKVVVLDKDKNVISQVALDNNIRKNLLADSKDPGYKISDDWTWNGNIYNTQTGQYEVPADGQYYLDYITKVDVDNATPQDYIVPVKVDTTAPDVNITSAGTASSTNYTLTWTATDNLSGIAGDQFVLLNGELLDTPVDYADGVYSVSLNLEQDKVNNIEIAAIDYANNIADKTFAVREGNVPFSLTFDNLSAGMMVDTSNYTVTGSFGFKPSVLKINGVDATINDDLTFSANIELAEGTNFVKVDARDVDGSSLANYAVKVYADTVAPVLNLTSPTVDKDGKTYTNTDTIKIAGTASDNTMGYKFYLNGEQQFVVNLNGDEGEQATLRNFEYTVPVNNNSFIEVKLVDLFGHETVKNINVVVDKTAPVITVKGVGDGKSYKTDVTPVISADEGQVTATLDGKAYDNSTITAEGTHELVVTAVDLAGNTSTYKVNFTIDKTAPVITVTGVEDGKLYNTDVKPVVSSNEGQITATLDGKAYDNSTVTTEGKHELVITVVDLAGNTSTSKVTFTLDKTAPVVNVKSVENGKTYDNTVKPEVTVSEGTFTMTLDGKEYKGDAVTATGNHELVINAKDAAGNTSNVTVKFTVRAVLSSTSTDAAAQAIANSTEKQVNVSLDNTTVVDDSLFKAVAGQDKNVSFTVNSNNTTLTWTFNAKEIDANNIKDVDLSLNASAPNIDTIAKIDGNAQVLSFKDNGVLPAPATIKIKLDSTKMDLTKPVYFYYYNPTTKTTEIIAGPLTPDKDGYVEVTIKHCSDYFFSNNDNEKTTAAVASLPKTGSMLDMNVLVGIGILLTAIGTLFVAGRRRRTE